VGVNTFYGKLLSFVVANFFAGIAGGLYASLIGNVDPSTAGLDLTFSWLVYILIGGVATLGGPILGTFVIAVLMEYLQSVAEYRLIIFGALLIVVIIYFPRGFMGAIMTLQQKFRDLQARRKGVTGAAAG
jgi:branched-chain amino acid transport system permease protein